MEIKDEEIREELSKVLDSYTEFKQKKICQK